MLSKCMSTKTCPALWNHIAIQQNGDYRVCCQCTYPPYGKPIKDNQAMNVQEYSIGEVRNSDLHKKIRLQMVNDIEPEECKLCFDQERLNLTSRRQYLKESYNTEYSLIDNQGSIDLNIHKIKSIDVRFGNLCNMKCRSCGPTDSSLWYEDIGQLNENKEIDFYTTKNYKLELKNNVWTLNNDDFFWYEEDKFWQAAESFLHSVDRIYITGGEPFINKAHWKLLDLAINLGVSKNILLEYNSNMSKLPANCFDIWKQFKRVDIGCSIDAVGDLAYYMRFPVKWDIIEKNIQTLSVSDTKNIYAKFAPTISVFNILGFLDVVELQHKYKSPVIRRNAPSFHMLVNPEWYNVQILPLETKKMIIERYNKWYSEDSWKMAFKSNFDKILDYMMQEDRSHLIPTFIEITRSLDRIRNQNLANTIPWLAASIGYTA